MNKMAIDPSKRSLGLYLNLDNTKDISFVIKSNQNESDSIIYKRISKKIKELIRKYNIELIFIEGFAYSKFKYRRSISEIIGVVGLIKSIIAQSNICKGIITVPISTWKSMFTSLPKIKNKQYINIINKLYGKSFSSSDEADAYLIMLSCYLIYQGFVKSNTQVELKKEILNYGEVWPIKSIKGGLNK